jgi:D-citramalate synthase
MVDGLDRLLAAEADAADAEPGAVADD